MIGLTALRVAMAAAIALSAPAVPGAQTPFDDQPPAKKFADSGQNARVGFAITLVLGDMKYTGASDTIPPPARKALGDVKDFLPYKEYRLLDSQWMLCCGGRPVLTRLKGPDQREYAVEVFVTRGGAKLEILQVRFVLSDAGASEKGAAGSAAAPAGDASAREPAGRDAPSRTVMDASFQMDITETVVVGTSRLKGGDNALIAVLTASPPRRRGEQ
jgi:hypothetical protein